MKKRVLAFVFLLLGTLAFVSCQKDDAEDGIFVRPDELAYLQGHFVGYNDEGVLQCWAGWQLNEADPGELSMKADDFESAVAIFRKIILPEANVEETETSLVWHLRGEDGQSQGDAVLSKASGDKVAVLTLPAAAKLVSRVNFIPHSLWPENGEQEYRPELDNFYFCNMVRVGVNLTQNPGTIFCRGNHGTGEFLVLQEYDQETNTWGYLLRMPNKARWWDDDFEAVKTLAPTQSTFEAVRKIYLEHQELFDKEMDKAGFAARNRVFLVDKTYRYGVFRFDKGYEGVGKGFYDFLVYRFGFNAYDQNKTQYTKYLILQ